MQPTNVNVSSLFRNDVQYIIPLFQRHYVWGKEDQWQPLWEDILRKCDIRKNDQKREAGSHFTGAIVIQQRPTNVDEVNKYEIIDGQQRLTTFQIILSTLRDVANTQGDEKIALEVNRYIRNEGLLSDAYSNEEYKLIPTEYDREAFLEIIDGKYDVNRYVCRNRVQGAYNYFYNQISGMANSEEYDLLSLFRVLQNDFGLVQILIDSDDEPEMIFESLNGRGKSLLQFDLLRNNLFLRTRISEHDRDKLYLKYWNHFETSFWEGEVKIGRRKEVMSELFMQHFLMANLATDNVTPLFKTYQKRYRPSMGDKFTATEELSALSKQSETYQKIFEADNDNLVGRYMRFYSIFEITSLHPFVLYLVNEERLDDEGLEAAFQMLESYTLRRMLCTTQGHKNFNKYFAELIHKLRKGGFSLEKLGSELSSSTSNTSRWPVDDEVIATLNGQWSSIGVNRKIIRYILYRVELYLRKTNRFTESDTLKFKQFTLEHIMPEKWEEHWPLPTIDGDLPYSDLFTDEYKEENKFWKLNPDVECLKKPTYIPAYELAVQRNANLNNVGNLTVLTQRLNSSVSNGAFPEKKEAICANSILMLNKGFQNQDGWAMEDIISRQNDIADVVIDIWPGPVEALEI